MTPREIRAKIAIAATEMDRFFDEGFTKWPEENFPVLLAGAAPEEDAISKALDTWEKAGAIRITREEACFVEVLRPISRTEHGAKP